MDNRHFAMDKIWTAHGQQSCPLSCPHLTHGSVNGRLPTSSTAAITATSLFFFFFFLKTAWRWDPPNAGWVSQGNGFRAHSPYQLVIESQRPYRSIQAVHRLRYPFSDHLTSDIIYPTHFLHASHRLTSTWWTFRSLCALPPAAIP